MINGEGCKIENALKESIKNIHISRENDLEQNFILTSRNILPQNSYVTVAIRSTLFVPETEHVTDLMRHDVLLVTTRTHRYLRFTVRLTDISPTSEIQK